MLKSKTPTSEGNSIQFVEQYNTAHKFLLEHFQSYTNPEFKIVKPINVLEPLKIDKTDPLSIFNATKVAILCENFIRQTKKTEKNLDETSRGDLAKWVKAGLGLIVAGQVSDLVDKVISEQPLTSRRGKIHYLDIVTEKSKGKIPSGLRMFDPLKGFAGTESFASFKVVEEPLGASGATDYVVTLEYKPQIPRSIEITDGSQVVIDDGNGNLIGDVGAAGGGITNTINYITGEVSMKFAAATTAPVVANYTYNIEAASEYPKYGISIRGHEVEAMPYVLMAEWNQLAVFDMIDDWGIDAEPTILDAGAKILNAEKFRRVVTHLHRRATGGNMVFDNEIPPALTYKEHIQSFGILLSRMMHGIWEVTQKVEPNVFVFAPNIWFLAQYTEGYQGEAATQADGLTGPKIVGTLANHGLLCIADPSFPKGKGLVTYRGGNILNTAAVLATHIPMWKSPVHTRGLHKDAILLSEDVIHVLNGDLMGKVEVHNL